MQSELEYVLKLQIPENDQRMNNQIQLGIHWLLCACSGTANCLSCVLTEAQVERHAKFGPDD